MATPETVVLEQVEAEGRKKGISRSIIIGLGGTGHDIVLDVRRRLIEKYDSLDNIPIVAFAVFDADATIKGTKPVSDDPRLNKDINLDPADKIHTAVRGMDSLLRELPSYPHLKSWIDPATLQGDVELGAGSIRARGRLAFFWNYADISKKIDEKYNQVKLKESVDQTQKVNKDLAVGEGVTVYLVGSLMGGTGSGMFLDAAYTVRQKVPDAQVIGIFTIPPASGAVAVDNRANTYAALLELNHYSDNSTIFEAQYARDQLPLSENVGSKPPFTYCYLVDKEGPTTHIEVSDLTSMIGNSIFLDLTSEFQRQKKSNRDNYSSFLTESDELGCPQSFVSFGLSSLYFPKDKIRAACSNRLAKTIIQDWMTPLDRSTNIPSFAAQEWLRLGLEHNHIKERLLDWDDGQGDGTIRDSIASQWNRLNQSYALDYPGHKMVADTLIAQDNAINEMLRDTDPNPDVTQKLRPNLGEYTRGMQGNLMAQLPDRKRALSTWVARIVNEPAHRHAIAREVLIQWGDMVSREVREIVNQANITREMTKGEEDRKSAAAQKINDYAGDFSLGMVPGARKKSVDEGKDAFVGIARLSHINQVEERVSDYLLKFYEEIQKHLSVMMGELDSYIVMITKLRDDFAAQEEQAIAHPTRINGQILFDPGAVTKDENGNNVFQGGDIDYYFSRFAGDAEVVNKAQNDIRQALRLDDTIYALMGVERSKIVAEMLKRCQNVFSGLENESVLERFYKLYKGSPTQAENQFKTVWNAAQPFVKINETDPNWKLKEQLKCKPTVAGLMHGNDPQTSYESDFLALMADQITGLDKQHIANNAENHQVLFIRERAAFPLRLLTGLESYKYVYDQEATRGGSTPIHTRADVTQWIRIHPPSQNAQWNAWETFVIGWASGVIEEVKTRQNTALGSFNVTSYRVTYTDNFGFPKTDELGQWRTLNEWDASKIGFNGAKKVDTTRPPLEALDIVLTLCDKKTLCQQIERTIRIRREQVGDLAFASAILAHAQTQQKAGLPFYETYYQTLVGDPNASPPRDGYLQKAGLTDVLQSANESVQNQLAAQSSPVAAITEVTITTPAPIAMGPNSVATPTPETPATVTPSLTPPPLNPPPLTPPPAIAAQSVWFYAVNGQQRGPVGTDALRELAALNVIDGQTKVWREGMENWAVASSTELASLFGAQTVNPTGPPPL